jgi:hypothetical protein
MKRFNIVNKITTENYHENYPLCMCGRRPEGIIEDNQTVTTDEESVEWLALLYICKKCYDELYQSIDNEEPVEVYWDKTYWGWVY